MGISVTLDFEYGETIPVFAIADALLEDEEALKELLDRLGHPELQDVLKSKVKPALRYAAQRLTRCPERRDPLTHQYWKGRSDAMVTLETYLEEALKGGGTEDKF